MRHAVRRCAHYFTSATFSRVPQQRRISQVNSTAIGCKWTKGELDVIMGYWRYPTCGKKQIFTINRKFILGVQIVTQAQYLQILSKVSIATGIVSE